MANFTDLAIEDCRKRFEAGEAKALLEAIDYCARSRTTMPLWVAEAYIARFDEWFRYRARTLDQAFGVDDVVIGVGQDHEALFDQDFRGFQQAGVVGEERLFVADDLELHPIGEADFAAQHGRAYSVVGGIASCRIRQDHDLFTIDEVEQ